MKTYKPFPFLVLLLTLSVASLLLLAGNNTQAAPYFFPLGDGRPDSVVSIDYAHGSQVCTLQTFTGEGNVVACWDGSAWSEIVSDFNGTVNVIQAVGERIYVGGKFSQVDGFLMSNIAYWDGNMWSSVGSGVSGVNSEVNSILVDGFEIYVGGSFSSINDGEAAQNIAYWDGDTWSALNGGLDGPVYAIAKAPNGRIFVGGSFSMAEGDGLSVKNIACWNETSWETVGGGLDGPVYTIAMLPSNMQSASHNASPDGISAPISDFYAGGSFITYKNGVRLENIARYTGLLWSAVGEGLENGPVDALAIDSLGNLYAAGYFALAGRTERFVRWDGSAWFGQGLPNGNIHSMSADGSGNVYLAGEFTSIEGVDAAHVVRYVDGVIQDPRETQTAIAIATETAQVGVTQTAAAAETQTVLTPTPTHTMTATTTPKSPTITAPTFTPTPSSTSTPTPDFRLWYFPFMIRQKPPTPALPTPIPIAESEPNDIFADADDIPTLPAEASGQHDGTAGTGDVFQFELTAGQVFAASLESMDMTGVQLLIYDAEGRELARAFEAPFALNVLAVSSGTYYLYLFTPAEIGNTSPYTVTLSVTGELAVQAVLVNPMDAGALQQAPQIADGEQ